MDESNQVNYDRMVRLAECASNMGAVVPQEVREYANFYLNDRIVRNYWFIVQVGPWKMCVESWYSMGSYDYYIREKLDNGERVDSQFLNFRDARKAVRDWVDSKFNFQSEF